VTANGAREVKSPVEAGESAGTLPPTGGPPRARLAWGPIVAPLLFVAAVAAITWIHQRQAPSTGGPFKLIDASTGRQVTDRDFRRK